jgi:hypothetical protein
MKIITGCSSNVLARPSALEARGMIETQVVEKNDPAGVAHILRARNYITENKFS